jgi:hypothetical protein
MFTLYLGLLYTYSYCSYLIWETVLKLNFSTKFLIFTGRKQFGLTSCEQNSRK